VCDKTVIGNDINLSFDREQQTDGAITFYFNARSIAACPTRTANGNSKPIGELGVMGLLMILYVTYCIFLLTNTP